MDISCTFRSSARPQRIFFFLLCVKLSVAGLALWLVGCERNPPPSAESSDSGMIYIAAAADLQFALPMIIDLFQQDHPEIKVRTTFGSSGNMRTQIAQQAPYDLFLSADIRYPELLIESGHAKADSLFTYALGQLVIWVPNNSPLNLENMSLKDLTDPRVRRIAIANPRHAPYGQAAVAALRHAGIHDEVADRLVYGENIAQAAQFVESGSADVGIIALALAIAPQMLERGRYRVIPPGYFPALNQGGAVMSHARNPEGAMLFRDFLLGPVGKDILTQFGLLEMDASGL